ncbi:hypothetical protein GGS26DRAFT_573826 [Hypomontagnella submonticulosa]|nr:hypothetical protein GGS26DRAFT_573826 [Hypomontagnella submonticulosa]
MTSDVNDSGRPSLEPIWTNYQTFGGMTKTTLRPTPINTALSPSPVSPKSLPCPSPIHPASYDGSMRRQDRALVNSFDQKPRPAVPLTPIDEYSPSPLVARLEKISILPPMSMAYGLPSPASPNFSAQGDIRERSGSIVTLPDALSESQSRSPGYYTANGNLTPVSPRRTSALEYQEQLRAWGHVYYGNTKTADAFIIARSLRRRNDNTEMEGARPKSLQVPGAASKSRLTIRAIVRPRAIDKAAFLIQRSFNIEELRATIPNPPSHKRASCGSDEQRRRSLPMAPSLIGAAAQSRSRRTSSVRSGSLLRASGSNLDVESLIRDANAVPIHLKYARAYLPVIAALLVSGHVREGDVIYLPMPHADAWPQTAQYVYTGQGELTDAIRENILYLAGKV